MGSECLDKSPVVNIGQTFVTKFGNVRLIAVYDSGSGQIGVKPVGWTNEVIFTTVDGRVETCGPVTVETNFFTLAGKGAHFWVCRITEDIPLIVKSITLNEYDPGRVTASVTVEGEGTGTLQIVWGTEETTTHSVSQGDYGYVRTMPVGTHEICAEIV